ncbi:MAG: hypothetical protein ACP5QD_02735, partial [Candidatus Ratteibacteria bacterium]
SIEAKGKQKCIYHLLDETKKVEEKNKFPIGSQEAWDRFHAGEETEENLKELRKFKYIIAQRITNTGARNHSVIMSIVQTGILNGK